MNGRIRLLMMVALMLVGSYFASADDLRKPRNGEIGLNPLQRVQEVAGVKVASPMWAFFQVVPNPPGTKVRVRLLADLSDLQRQVGVLVDTLALPTNNCDHFGADNVVARIWGKDLSIAADTATLELRGDVDVWACIQAPPCTKLEGWRLVFFDCNSPFKNRNLSQPFTARLPIRLVAVDPRTLAVQLGQPTVDLGGPLGGVTGTILKIAGVEINQRVEDMIDSAIRPESLRLTLGSELVPIDTVITQASFVNDGGGLAASVELEAPLDPTTLAKLLGLVVNPNGQQ